MTIRPTGAHTRALRRTAVIAALALSSVLVAAPGGSTATVYSTGCHSPLYWLNLASPARTRTPASLLPGMGRVFEENFRPAGIALHEHGEGA